MSKFEKFLTDSKKILIDNIIVVKEKNMLTNFQKRLNFAIKGLALVTLISPLAANANFDYQTAKSEEVKQVIKNFSSTSSYPLHNTLITITSQKKNETYAAHDMGEIQTCKISVSVDNNGDILRFSRGFNKLDKKMYEEMVVNHELSHCITDKKFSGSTLSVKSEKWMNDWVVGEYVADNSIKNIFEENFADTHGALVFLNKNNFSAESVNFLKEWSKARKALSDQSEQNGVYFDSHNTHNSLDLIIDNIDKLKQVETSDYKALSDEIASKSVLLILNKNRQIEEEFYINDEGDIAVTGKKINLGSKGSVLLNEVLSDYKVSLLNVSSKIIYDLNDGKDLKEDNSGLYKIAKDGVFFFNESSWKLNSNGSIKDISKQLNGSYYDNVVKNYRNKNGYKEFISEVNMKLVMNKSIMKLNINFDPSVVFVNNEKERISSRKDVKINERLKF